MKKVIASILTIVLSIPLFVSTPLANTVSQSYTTGYGSYYFTYNNDLDTFLLQLGNLGGVNMKGYCQSLIYEFNDTYSGYLDIHLLSESIWNNATIITENCYVKGKNSAQRDYSIGFKDVTSIKVTVVLPTLTTNNAWSGNKMALTTNYNITRDITSVEDYLEDIETTMGQIDAQLSTMATSLSNIYGVESASRQLLSEIEYAIRGNNSLYVLSDDIGTIIYDLNAIVTNVSSINNQQKFITNYSYINEYNSQAYNLFYKYDHTINYRDTFMSVTVTSNDNSFNGVKATSFNPGYCLLFAYSGNAINDMIPYVANTSTSYIQYNYLGRYYQFNIYEIVWTHTQRDWISFKINSGEIIPFYFGYKNNMPSVIYNQFYSGDNPLISSIKAVESAVRSMAVNVNNLTVNATGITYNVNNTQVNNSVTTYNTNINQVYNIENNFGTQLDTQLQNYNPDNTNIISRLTASGNIMATVLNGINGIELFTIPISVMLVGIVLLAIVG